MGSPAAAGGLLVSQVNHAFRSALRGLLHCQHIGGVDGREVANVAGKGRSGQRGVKRRQIVRVFLSGFSHCSDWGTVKLQIPFDFAQGRLSAALGVCDFIGFI